LPIKICPICRNRVQTAKNNNDVLHTCRSGDSSRDNEDVPVIGDFENFGVSGKINKWEVAYAGIQDQLQGTVANIEGESFVPRTERGNRKYTHRTRKRIKYIDFRN